MRFKKKQIAIILLLLLLPIATLAVGGMLHSHSSTDTYILDFSAGGYAYGQGVLAKDVSVISIDTDTYYDLLLYRPTDWSISSINITLSNISAPTYENVLEDYGAAALPLYPEPVANPEIIIVGAMAFNLTYGQRVYFNRLSALLFKVPFNESAYVDIAILNATYQEPWGLIPNAKLFSINNVSVEGGPLEFKDFFLVPPDQYLFLDPSINQTEQNTYFVAITQNISTVNSFLYWFYDPDSHNGDSGLAYWMVFNVSAEPPLQFFGSIDPAYLNDTFDLCLKLYLNATPPSQQNPLPTDIGLAINGTSVNDIGQGSGWWSTSENLSLNPLSFDIFSTWYTTVSFAANISITYQMVLNPLLVALTQTFFAMTYFNSYFGNQGRSNEYLLILALGSVVVAGAGGYTANKRRIIPRNALRSIEHIIVDHNASGVLIWSFDFVSMQQDVALISGFMSAIKSFLEEMKVGGLKRLSTEFGTFIREESQLLTTTCITSDIGLNEELWIRGKLHKFLTQVEQTHRKQLKDWKGDVSQFRESFPAALGSVIDMERVQGLHKQKVANLNRKKKVLQEELNKYGAKLEELKARHDSGELSYDEYTEKRLKTEVKYDKVQKDYIYASLFLSKVPPETAVTPTDAVELEEIQKRFLEIRLEIEGLRRKESEGTITPADRKHKVKLQKELMKLVEQLHRFQQG